MTETGDRRRGNGAGIMAIAAAYIYFLLYAQFGFVSYLKLFFPDPLHTKNCMGAMGAGGLLFSVLAAILLRKQEPRRLLAVSFAGCAAAALFSLTARTPSVFYVSAFLIGSFTGLVTVILAAGLRTWITSPRFGLHVGVGTGLAYFICNIPQLFGATPLLQTVFSAAIGIVGVFAARVRPSHEPDVPVSQSKLSAAEFRGWGFASIVMLFFALIWFDSTAFAAIQLNEDLRAHTWGSPPMMLTLGLCHAISAIAAGWLIDRGLMRSLLAAAFGLFVLSLALLQQHVTEWVSGPLYVCGVSIYSTALVAFPTLHAGKPGLVPVRWRAAILYAVAGWIGSGLGVGLAQQLHSVPAWVVLSVGILVGIGLLLSPGRLGRKLFRSFSPLFAVGIAGAAYFSIEPGNATPAIPSREWGRAVYRQEGCINCHSQFLRRNTADILLWGPYRDIDRKEKPPMVGNRRQGPDLMNAGLRRSALWHRQHLIDPQSLSPGSKMPSYAYLFREGDPRGDALVMYLASLGEGAEAERFAMIRKWKPSPSQTQASAANGRRLFETYCHMCHGAQGRADGPLSPIFNQPGMNLAKGPFMYVPADLEESEESDALARIVKFGIAGLNMPGHEYLSDRDVADIVSYVKTLAGREQVTP